MRNTLIIITALISVSFFHISCNQPYFANDGTIIEISSPQSNINFNESVIITVTGYIEDGSLIWDGTRINLSIENGILSAPYIEFKNGRAEVTAIGSQQRGPMNIYARSGSVTATPYPLSITVGTHPLVSEIIIFADPQFLESEGGTAKITAYLYDEYYQPIYDRAVLFSTGKGSLQSRGRPRYTDNEGKVVDYLTTTLGTWVTARSGEKEASIYVYVDGN